MTKRLPIEKACITDTRNLWQQITVTMPVNNMNPLKLLFQSLYVTGHFKTSQSGSNQNQPL
jgi:hypothetical protein